MKSCDEMVKSLLARRELYFAEQRKKRRVIAAASVGSVCLAALLGFSLWRFGAFEGKADEPPVDDGYAVNTDSTRLPEDNCDDNYDWSADVVASLIHKGNIYSISMCFYDNVSYYAEKYIDRYIGEAKDVLDEWSPLEDWKKELASTGSGTVYTVKGYDEDYRLCIYMDDGEQSRLEFFDNYNGIELNTGADLFEKYLHIMGNVESVTYRTHENWNMSSNFAEYHDLTGVTEEQFEAFLNELYRSPFVQVEYDSDALSSSKARGHLYLNMKDGTCVHLIMIEGGYVTNGSTGTPRNDFGYILVKMPGELFNQVLAACQ